MLKGFKLAAAGVSLLISASMARAASVSYSATTGLPGGQIGYFDATHPINPNPVGFTPFQTVSNNIMQVGPTDTSKYSFYYVNSLVLDHTQNVEIDATLKLDSQTSTKPNDRSGLALGLTDDRNLYSEFYIGNGEIFLNKFGRVRDVSASLDTSIFHDYSMKLHGDDITISVDNVPTLSGKIFNASGFGLPTLANYGAVGDITSDAQSSFEMKSFSVSVTPIAAVPLPTAAMMSLLTLPLAIFAMRKSSLPAKA